MKKSFYIGSIAGAGILGIVLLIVGGIEGRTEGFSLFGYLMVMYAMIVALGMWYKAWQAIQDGHARTTPGMAIVFLFIPIFNFYWCFQAFWGFAKDYNSYISRHGISIPELPSGLFLAYSIFYLVFILLGLGLGFTAQLKVVKVGILISLVILAVIANKICDAVNALPRYRSIEFG